MCPVCGCNLDFEPWRNGYASAEMCPCCGIQYGLDDMAGGKIEKRQLIYDAWRKKWIKDGMPWKSQGIQKPDNWDPERQLNNLK